MGQETSTRYSQCQIATFVRKKRQNQHNWNHQKTWDQIELSWLISFASCQAFVEWNVSPLVTQLPETFPSWFCPIPLTFRAHLLSLRSEKLRNAHVTAHLRESINRDRTSLSSSFDKSPPFGMQNSTAGADTGLIGTPRCIPQWEIKIGDYEWIFMQRQGLFAKDNIRDFCFASARARLRNPSLSGKNKIEIYFLVFSIFQLVGRVLKGGAPSTTFRL